MMTENQENKEKKEVSEKTPQTYISAKDLVSFAFGLIEEKAWISLGLIKDTDNQIHKSKADATMLINILSKMLEGMNESYDEETLKEVKSHITNLQLNFVNQFKD